MSSFTRRVKMVRGAVRLPVLLALLAGALLPVWLWADTPVWWAQRGVLNTAPGVVADDYAAVNQGQVKQIATQAIEEFDDKLPGGAGPLLLDLSSKLYYVSATTDDYSVANIGQLKNIAKPFYDRLIELGYRTDYPWSSSTMPRDDYALANVGQLKSLFAFTIADPVDPGAEPVPPPAPSPPPSVPRPPPVTDFSVQGRSATAVVFTWTAVTPLEGGGRPIAGYRIYQDGDLLAEITSTTYSFSPPDSYARHTFSVRSVDDEGRISINSTPITVVFNPTVQVGNGYYGYYGIESRVVTAGRHKWGFSEFTDEAHPAHVPPVIYKQTQQNIAGGGTATDSYYQSDDDWETASDSFESKESNYTQTRYYTPSSNRWTDLVAGHIDFSQVSDGHTYSGDSSYIWHNDNGYSGDWSLMPSHPDSTEGYAIFSGQYSSHSSSTGSEPSSSSGLMQSCSPYAVFYGDASYSLDYTQRSTTYTYASSYDNEYSNGERSFSGSDTTVLSDEFTTSELKGLAAADVASIEPSSLGWNANDYLHDGELSDSPYYYYYYYGWNNGGLASRWLAASEDTVVLSRSQYRLKAYNGTGEAQLPRTYSFHWLEVFHPFGSDPANPPPPHVLNRREATVSTSAEYAYTDAYDLAVPSEPGYVTVELYDPQLQISASNGSWYDDSYYGYYYNYNGYDGYYGYEGYDNGYYDYYSDYYWYDGYYGYYDYYNYLGSDYYYGASNQLAEESYAGWSSVTTGVPILISRNDDYREGKMVSSEPVPDCDDASPVTADGAHFVLENLHPLRGSSYGTWWNYDLSDSAGVSSATLRVTAGTDKIRLISVKRDRIGVEGQKTVDDWHEQGTTLDLKHDFYAQDGAYADSDVFLEGAKPGLATLQLDIKKYDQTITVTRIVNVVSARLLVDIDRNGVIDEADYRAEATKTYPFWLNEGVDGEDETLEPGTFGSTHDYQATSIQHKRDLDDWSRLQIHVAGLDAVATEGSGLTARLEWSTSDAPTLKFVAAVDASKDYLKTTAGAAQQIAGTAGVVIGEVSANATYEIPAAQWKPSAGGGLELNLLFEGAAKGVGRLTLAFYRDGRNVGQALEPVAFRIRPLSEFYEHWTANADDTTVKGAPISPVPVHPDGLHPAHFEYSSTEPGLSLPGDPEEDEYILFVHGWRMKPWERRAFAETALKRLFHLGYRGKFGFFSWPTEWVNFDGWWPDVVLHAGLDPQNYTRSEVAARRSGSGPLSVLLTRLRDRTGTSHPEKLHIFAHSMGNIVISEALRSLPDGVQVGAQYVSCQSAETASAYDGVVRLNTGDGGVDLTPTISKPWSGGPDRFTYSALSPRIMDSTVSDLTRPGYYYTGLKSRVPIIVSFFNRADAAMSKAKLNQKVKPDNLAYLWDATYSYRDDVKMPDGISTVPPINGMQAIRDHYQEDPVGLNNKRELHWDVPDERYRILAHITAGRGFPVGAAIGIAGEYETASQQDLNNVNSYNFTTLHSAEFLQYAALRRGFYRELLRNFEIDKYE